MPKASKKRPEAAAKKLPGKFEDKAASDREPSTMSASPRVTVDTPVGKMTFVLIGGKTQVTTVPPGHFDA